jgi:outer membrane immunogenic protein
MKRTVILGLGLLAIATAPAIAADIPVKAPVRAPVVAPAFSWTGFYIGVNAGYGWGSNTMNLRPSPDAISQAFWNPAFLAGAVPGAYGLKPDGFIGGGQIGYNMQFGTWLLGVEADLQYSNIKDSIAVATAGIPGFVPASFTASQDLRWLGTARGRIGVTWDALLIYATGGAAFGETNYGYTLSAPATLDFHTISASTTKFGWTVGGGLEYAFGGNWSVKGEYLYVDLDNETFLTVPSGRAANLLTSFTADYSNRYHIARLGLNYRFGAPPPVVARY